MTKFKIDRIVIEKRQIDRMVDTDVNKIARKYRAAVFVADGSNNDAIVSVIKKQAFDYVRSKNK